MPECPYSYLITVRKYNGEVGNGVGVEIKEKENMLMQETSFLEDLLFSTLVMTVMSNHENMKKIIIFKKLLPKLLFFARCSHL